MLNKYTIIKKPLVLFIMILIFAPILSAAEFLATVPNNQVSLGQGINLTLTLDGAKPKEDPDLAPLAKDFTIYGQQQYSTYSNHNGTITSELGWEISLIPKKEGVVVIPSIGIITNKGKLATQEIKITVTPAQAGTNNNSIGQDIQDNIGVSLISSTNKAKPYVKEPVIYTLKVISYRPIASVALDDITANDAIIDKIGQPKQYTQTLGGMRANIIEIKYHVIPLVAGKIEIAPAVIHGEIQAPSPQAPKNNRFGMLNNFFFDNMVTLRPFVLQSDKITLNVAAPPIADKNWLPLNKLELTEEWSKSSGAIVGDTIVRKVKIKGTGSFSNQLPSVKDYMDIRDIKLYTDNPVLTDNVSQDNDLIIGSKQESFSIVPQQAGKLHFPEVRITWWNLNTKRSEVSVLPARTIDVLPAAKGAAKDTTIDYSAGQEKVISDVESKSFWTTIKENKWIIILLASLVIVIFSMFAIIVYLLKNKNTSASTKVKTKNTKTAKELKEIVTAEDLRDHILEHANKYWRTPTNITLNKLGTFLSENNYSYDLELYINLCKEINAALYASAGMDLQEMTGTWEQLKASIIKSKEARIVEKDEDFINLNPT